jgi:hypothetical protein
MVLGLAEGATLRVTLFPFPSLSCSRGRSEARESDGFKSETCVDDSMGAAQLRVPCPFLCLAPWISHMLLFVQSMPRSILYRDEFVSGPIAIGAE